MAQLVIIVLEIDKKENLGRPAVEQVPVTEPQLAVIISKIVELLLIPVPQNVRGITNIPVQPESVVFTTPIPPPLKVTTVQEAALLIQVPVPPQLTMPEALTSATKRETYIDVMVLVLLMQVVTMM